MIYKESGNVPGRKTYKLVGAPSSPPTTSSFPEGTNMDQESTPIVTRPCNDNEEFPAEAFFHSNQEEEVKKPWGKVGQVFSFSFVDRY